ncbi:aryl hydrocarbon receptor-like [Poeciliopsis prolifica]|uniref:aryl hydrocarbon receptor-like n=1 Tax=Poeciliopsis prolifica TaxID=188132 RepID=UPI0024140F1A|nr:aryl hydrocarbon receptor-like [Poeciliopsis prolifica]
MKSVECAAPLQVGVEETLLLSASCLTRRRDALHSGANCANALRVCCSETGLCCVTFLSSSFADGFGFVIPIIGHAVCERQILAERWPVSSACPSRKGADMYAGRKRRKPVQRAVKQPPAEGTKSNPSKRHRDRLNGELEQLASLLPFSEEVTASLDKLSILRLSVSYLRAKNFFSVALSSQKGATGARGNIEKPGGGEKQVREGELLLQALSGFVLVTSADGTIFYSSHTIQDYLGFHQTDVIHQSVYELVHTEDQQELRRNLHWALNPPQAAASAMSHDSPQEMELDSSSLVTYNPKQLPPENSSFLERNFVCRFRCLLDNSSGFLALNIQGRLKFLHGQNQEQENGGKGMTQLALFAIATPLQPPSILEIRTKNMIFRTKHKLDFTPLACDAKGKIVLGYTEAELRVRGSGYQFIHAADMLYCAENHVRMIKTGESGLTVFRLLTKENRWKWVQANARLVYKNGKPDYIIATQRPLLDEEGGEHLRKRSMHLPFTFATGEALLYQSNHPIAGFIDGSQEKNSSKSKKSRTERLARDGLDPGSLLGALMSQDQSVYVCQPVLEPKTAFHSSFVGEQTHFSVSEISRQSQSWDVPHNGVLEPGISEPSASLDPLLATLDSLTLEGHGVVDAEDGSCSNSELFGALEGLGLSAEDLELLLLDERMIRVEMDSDHVPTLDDLLTNDEILSYIYNCIEGRAVFMEHGRQTLPRTAATIPTTVSASENNPRSGVDLQMHFPHCKPCLVGQTPIVQLSQQMQQHLNMRKGKLGHDWSQHTNQMTNGELLGHNPALHNGHWTAQDTLTHAGLHLQHTNTQHMVFSNKATELDGQFLQQQMHQQLQHYQQSITQRQLFEHCHVQQRPITLNGMCDAFSNWSPTKPQWQDFGFTESLGNDLCPGNSQKPHAITSLDLCTNYGVVEMPNVDSTVSGSALYGKVGQQDGSEFTVSSFQQQQEEEITVPFTQCPLPKTSLEQIVGVGKPCSQPDHSDRMSSEIGHDPSNNKMKGCILDASYPGGCVLPNDNGAAPPAVKVASSETIHQVPD